MGALRGAGAGLVIGSAAGGVVGLVSGDSGRDCWFFCTAGEKAIVYGGALGLLGTVVGTIAGVTSPGEKWRTVERAAGRPRASVDVRPAKGGGAGVSVRLSF
jgi:hypothetical protein